MRNILDITRADRRVDVHTDGPTYSITNTHYGIDSNRTVVLNMYARDAIEIARVILEDHATTTLESPRVTGTPSA